MRTREDRINAKSKKLSKCRKLAKVKWYKGYAYKSPTDRFELDPDKCYFTEASKYKMKKFYKKQSIKAIRNKYKKDLINNPEETSAYNGAANKLFDYWWSIY